MRTLYYLPVIHHETETDYDVTLKYVSKRKRQVYCKRVERYYEIAGEWANEIRHVDKLYTDCMCTGPEIGNGVHDKMVKKGSPLARIEAEFLKKGAKLMKTESIPLVMASFQYMALVDALCKRKDEKVPPELWKKGKALMKKRDIFIGHRIDLTLREGEVGWLSIGANHRIKFADDINLELFCRPGTAVKYMHAAAALK